MAEGALVGATLDGSRSSTRPRANAALPPLVPEKIRPLGDKVFVETFQYERTSSGLFLPLEYQNKYPDSGTVIACGPKCTEVKPGDIVRLLDEGCDIEKTYWQVCMLVLKDWEEPVEYCDVEAWAPIREAVESYRSSPTGKDYQIAIKTINGYDLHFLASDVLDYAVTEIDNPHLRLNYVNAAILHLGTKMYYFVSERLILFTEKSP